MADEYRLVERTYGNGRVEYVIQIGGGRRAWTDHCVYALRREAEAWINQQRQVRAATTYADRVVE